MKCQLYPSAANSQQFQSLKNNLKPRNLNLRILKAKITGRVQLFNAFQPATLETRLKGRKKIFQTIGCSQLFGRSCAARLFTFLKSRSMCRGRRLNVVVRAQAFLRDVLEFQEFRDLN